MGGGNLAVWLLCAVLSACVRSGAPAAPAPAPVSLDLPAPGTYVLDRIMPAPPGIVLDSDGTPQPLEQFTRGKVTLFAFIYTACSDARGCPLALATMHALKAEIGRDALLREQVRFVSMSFDPAFDTPTLMRSYGGADAKAGARPRWYFLTAASDRELAPVLEGFGQDVVLADGAGRTALSHLLKIYLIDQNGVVREIYSPAFLQPEAILGDIRSLLAEADSS